VLSKCLNPICCEPFRYFHDGRLFNLEVPNPSPAPAPKRRLERFWLCNRCSTHLTVVVKDGRVLIQPRFLDLYSGERVEQPEAEEPFLP
jgi:hypothetical protein